MWALGATGQFWGLGGTIAAGTAVYSLFNFLDRKASPDANKTLVAWLKNEVYSRVDLRDAIVGAFDHLYGTPLLRLRTFLRSMALSTLSCLIYALFEIGSLPKSPAHIDATAVAYIYIVSALPGIVFSDYISLFVVRRCLTIANLNMREAILFALISGVAVIGVLYVVEITLAAWLSGEPFTEAVGGSLYFFFGEDSRKVRLEGALVFFKLVLPAGFVYSWLLLLLVAATANHGIKIFFRGVGFFRWFSKRGENHPLNAIGMTAAGLILAAGCVYQLIHHL